MESYNDFIFQLDKHLRFYSDGTLFVISLLNLYELDLIGCKNRDGIIESFKYALKEFCGKLNTKIICDQYNAKLCFRLNLLNSRNARVIASQINHILQEDALHNDKKYYFRYVVSSINFSEKLTYKTDELITLLHIATSKFQYFTDNYYRYESNSLSIPNIKNSQCNLYIVRKSIKENTIKFVYQPIIDRKTGAIIYYECLMRILNSDGNFISIGTIIKDIEEHGLIDVIDKIALQMVIDELSQNPDIVLSVNISNYGVISKVLLDFATNLLQKESIAKRLIIEITETALNQDFKSTAIFIKNLRKLGCRFAVDDFGSGFTSFKQLFRLPIDIIKIDGSYIKDILNNKKSKFFVESFIKLAEELRIKTVAEFVESNSIASYLESMSIDWMQGNFILPASDNRVDSHDILLCPQSY